MENLQILEHTLHSKTWKHTLHSNTSRSAIKTGWVEVKHFQKNVFMVVSWKMGSSFSFWTAIHYNCKSLHISDFMLPAKNQGFFSFYLFIHACYVYVSLGFILISLIFLLRHSSFTHLHFFLIFLLKIIYSVPFIGIFCCLFSYIHNFIFHQLLFFLSFSTT